MSGYEFSPRADRKALRDRFDILMDCRPGETEADCAARRRACAALSVANTVAGYRKRIIAANAHLQAMNISQDDRIALLRASVSEDYGWLAAEVVHGWPPARDLLTEVLEGGFGE